jgi:hypothetical protein
MEAGPAAPSRGAATFSSIAAGRHSGATVGRNAGGGEMAEGFPTGVRDQAGGCHFAGSGGDRRLGTITPLKRLGPEASYCHGRLVSGTEGEAQA